MKLSSVLTVLSSIGVVVTGYLAGIAGSKINEKGFKGSDFKDLNTLKEVAPDIAPPIITGGLTIAGVVGAQRLNAKQIAVMGASGLATAEMLKRYKEKTKELIGVDKYNEIKAKVMEEVDQKAKLITAKKPEDNETFPVEMDETIWIVDSYTERKWLGTLTEVYKNELEFNRIFATEDKASIADWMDIWGQEPEFEHQTIGFDLEYISSILNYAWIDFEHTWTKAEDGKKQLTITFDPEPIYSSYLHKWFFGEE